MWVHRILNVQVGEASRHAWLGIEADPLVLSDKLAYSRPSEGTDQKASSWVISKNAVISGLGLFGIKQGEGEQTAPKARRKRVVRRKVASSA